MKAFYIAPSVVLFLFISVTMIYPQTVHTTLEEMYGRNGFTIMKNNSVEKIMDGSWTQGVDMPYPRYYSGSVMYARNDTLWLYVFGGDTTGGGVATKTCLRYNVNTDTWEYIAPLPVPMRVNAATKLGDKLYTMGGFSAPFPSPALTDFYEYDVNTNTWSQMPDLPVPLFFHGAEGFEDSLIYIMGGIVYTPSRTEEWSDKTFLFNWNNQSFRPATILPIPIASFAHSKYQNSFIINSGLKSETELSNSTFKGDIDLGNRQNINWTQRTNHPLSLYASYSAPFPNGEIYSAGGSNTPDLTPVDYVFEYDLNIDVYNSADPLPVAGMAYSAGVINIIHSQNDYNDLEIVTIVIAGGIILGPAITNQTWIFTDTVEVSGLNEIINIIPSSYSLSQNYPNPFNPSTTIQFSIPEQSFVKLEIYNALGEKVSTLVSEELGAGNYKYEWNAENLTSGIYFYRIETPGYSESKKMILIK